MATAKTTESYRIAGVYEPIEYTIEYKVCDECGASDICEVGSHVSGSINGAFSVVIIMSFYGTFILGLITFDLQLCDGLGMLSVVALILYLSLMKYVERNNHLKCNKCGNEHIT